MNSINKVFLSKIKSLKPLVEFTANGKEINLSTHIRSNKKSLVINLYFASSMSDEDTINKIQEQYPQIDTTAPEILEYLLLIKRMCDLKEDDKEIISLMNQNSKNDFFANMTNMFKELEFKKLQASANEIYH